MFSRTMFGDRVCQSTKPVDQAPARLRPSGLRRGSLRYDRLAEPKLAEPAKAGGARRDRTDDLMLAKHALSQLSYGPVPEDECYLLAFAGASAQQPSFKKACRAEAAEQRRLVGLGRLELPTSRLSSARSNQLSYKPSYTRNRLARTGLHQMISTSAAPGACSSAKKEKRRRRNPANGAQRSGDRWPLMFQKRFDKSKLLKNHP
jgi:DNA-binding PucR family transcriptional regulator